jgi:hypothetical protein
MTSDLDIYRSANLLVKRHGEDAPIEAAMRVGAIASTQNFHKNRTAPIPAMKPSETAQHLG